MKREKCKHSFQRYDKQSNSTFFIRSNKRRIYDTCVCVDEGVSLQKIWIFFHLIYVFFHILYDNIIWSSLLLVCLFVCLFGVLRPTREFFTHFWDVTITGKGLQILTYARHLWSMSNEDPFRAIHVLLWHGSSVYNGHLREPVTLTPVANCLAVELSVPVLKT